MNYSTGSSLPIDFKNFYYEDWKEFFGKMETKEDCVLFLLSYTGDNWVIPYVCGKRTAYLSLIERGEDITWEQACSM